MKAGELFRIVLTRILNQRVLDVTSDDAGLVSLLFENGDTMTVGAFSYETPTEEEAAKLRASLEPLIASGNLETEIDFGKSTTFNFCLDLDEDDDDEDDVNDEEEG